jgi:hypothetical protein
MLAADFHSTRCIVEVPSTLWSGAGLKMIAMAGGKRNLANAPNCHLTAAREIAEVRVPIARVLSFGFIINFPDDKEHVGTHGGALFE